MLRHALLALSVLGASLSKTSWPSELRPVARDLGSKISLPSVRCPGASSAEMCLGHAQRRRARAQNRPGQALAVALGLALAIPGQGRANKLGIFKL
jgi:hypothetical protein